jgi:hypothetical protein
MLSGTSDLTKRPYARSTINGRLRILALFYSWCAQRGLIAGVPFTTGELAVGRTRAPQMLAHIDARGGRQRVNKLTVRHTRVAASIADRGDPAGDGAYPSGSCSGPRSITCWSPLPQVSR